MNKTEKIIKNTFELGSIRDAGLFLELCIRNAFPDFNFRGLETIRLTTGEKAIEGKSWNHVFNIRLTDKDGQAVYEISCKRVSGGDANARVACLDAYTLKAV